MQHLHCSSEISSTNNIMRICKSIHVSVLFAYGMVFEKKYALNYKMIYENIIQVVLLIITSQPISIKNEKKNWKKQKKNGKWTVNASDTNV